jgi:hypothetical protein
MALPAQIKKVWQNCVGLQIAHPLRFFKPATIHELIGIVEDAERKGYKVKATGSGHSFSDVALTRDYLINTHGLKNILPLSLLTLKHQDDSKNLFLTECGIRIHVLNAVLNKQKKALINMGAYTGQTIIGAISTSTHGSGVTLDSLPGFVEAIILVGEKGRVFHIERSQGPSTAPMHINGLQAELIQDDDVFLSSVVSMGCLGIVYAVLLRVCDNYLLQEKRTFCTWDEIKPKLKQGDILLDNRHLEVLIDPYSVNRPSNDCLVTERNICPADTPTNWFRLHRALGYTLIGWLIPPFLLNAFLRFIFNHFPKITPWILKISLKTLRDGCYIGPSFKVLDLGSANNISAYSTEIAFPANRYLDAVEALLALFKKTCKEGQQYITSPFSLRFVKKSEHYLAMQYGDEPGFVCMIEFPVLNGTIGGIEMLARVESEMYRYGGIPHWGQYNHVGIGEETLNKLYPQFSKWMENYKRMCPNGTFQNDFTERCGIVA